MALQVGDEVPENDLPQAAAQSPASDEVPSDDLPEVPAHDLPQDISQYEGGLEQAKAGVEGLAQGVVGPLATLAETKLLGVSPEAITGRAEANPWTHGIGEAVGLGGGLLTGTGEAGLIAKAGSAVEAAANLGKVGSTVLKGAVEAGMFQGGDEISKYILGQSDPEAPVSSALAHMGAASLLGGGMGAAFGKIGGKLEEIAAGKTASKATQFLADFGNRFNFLTKNQDVAGSATEEIKNLWDAVQSAYDATWGSAGLKRQAVEKLVPEMNDGIFNQFNDVTGKVQKTIDMMRKRETLYPSYLVEQLQDHLNEATAGQNMSSADVFNKIQDLKTKLQDFSKYGKKFTSVDPQGQFIQAVRNLAPQVREALENEDVWGDAAKLQKGVNSAFSELQPYQKDFLKSFTQEKLGEREINPDGVYGMLRQIGRGRGALRASKLGDFIEPAQKFLQEVDDLHNQLGVSSNIPKVSTNVLDEMLNKPSSPGARMADYIFGGAPKTMGLVGGRALGTIVGGMTGHPYLGYRAGENFAPIVEEGLGRKLTRWGVHGALKALSANDPEGVHSAIQYAENIGKGGTKINNAVQNIFTVGGQKALNSTHSEKDRENLRKFVESGQLNQEINQPPKTEEQKFAHGGMVLAPEPHQVVTKAVPPVTKGIGKLSGTYPDQSMMLGMVKGRVNNYLNSVRPQSVQPKLPFDLATKNPEHERKYDHILNLANNPLSVLDHVKSGSLSPEHVQHMKGMYPELYNHLQGKLSEGIAKAQMDDHKPNHAITQSLSLFMGSPLESHLTPQNIMAAQSVFAMQNAQKTMGATKGNKLDKLSDQHRTAEQASESRQTSIKP